MWIVTENTPGYLPDSEPAAFDEYVDALRYMHELGDELVESGMKLVSVNDVSMELTDPEKIHDLGRTIEILEVR